MEQFELVNLEWQDDELIFRGSNGGPIPPDSVTHAFKKLP